LKHQRILFDKNKWTELVNVAKNNSRFRAFSLFQKRRRRYPCQVVDYKEINVQMKAPGVFRFPGVNYPVGTSVRNCGELIMQNEPLELTLHLAYWIGRAQTNLTILMKNLLPNDNDYRAFWVDNDTDGAFIPVKIELTDSFLPLE
jgi:hypothetical protein